MEGREGLPAGQNVVERMMDWVASQEYQVLEKKGFGTDNIFYYQLGHNAKQVMEAGGFENLFKIRRRRNVTQSVLAWAPIAVSIIAVVVSVFALNKQEDNKNKERLSANEIVLLRAILTSPEKNSILESGVHKETNPPSKAVKANQPATSR